MNLVLEIERYGMGIEMMMDLISGGFVLYIKEHSQANKLWAALWFLRCLQHFPTWS